MGSYWTVVSHAEVEDLAHFERHMGSYGSRPEVREALGDYMTLVAEGQREIYRVI